MILGRAAPHPSWVRARGRSSGAVEVRLIPLSSSRAGAYFLGRLGMRLVSAQETGLPDYAVSYCSRLGVLPDGRVCGVHRLLYHWTLLVDLNPIGYEDRYCYATEAAALAALAEWDGEGDPKGWHRHPKSGRRRDPVTGREWVSP